MSARAGRVLAYGALAAIFLLHHDLWLWHDPSRVLGLPAGLTYHLVYCLAAAGVMALLLRYAWPAELASRYPATDVEPTAD